jgi:hypothetical protein
VTTTPNEPGPNEPVGVTEEEAAQAVQENEEVQPVDTQPGVGVEDRADVDPGEVDH